MTTGGHGLFIFSGAEALQHMEGYAFYRYILEAPCSIAQRQPVHAAAYTIVGICISVKQKSTINMASTVIPAAAVNPPSIDFLMYIIKHTFL